MVSGLHISLELFGIYLVATYLVGSIPFGLLLTKIFTGKDIRQHGSGNIGATNVTRVAGKLLGLLTLLGDGLKGAAMVLIARYYLLSNFFAFTWLYAVGLAAILGHIFPIYLRFHGGKGVATTFAVFLAVDFRLGIFVMLLWCLTFLLFRMSSLAALISLTAATVLSLIFLEHETFLFSLLASCIIFYRHRTNIVKILRGEEDRFELIKHTFNKRVESTNNQ